MGCCGGIGTAASLRDSLDMMSIRDEAEDEQVQVVVLEESTQIPADQECPAAEINLAAALAAERQFRGPNNEGENDTLAPAVRSTPLRVSLMRLLEEADGVDEASEKEGGGGGGGGGSDGLCCVCMGRRKGAAFIPCGHTFCRGCSRELWLNRGYCPICNHTILEILDIF